jgi:hypothetical protein
MYCCFRGLETLASVNMDLDLPVDPNEPTYCYCGQVSYGEMIACDNPEVRYGINFKS